MTTEREDGCPFSELRDTGLLWLINTTVFHPRGYALAVNIDDEGNATGWKLLGDGTEPWMFAESEEERVTECFQATKELMP